MGTWGQPGYVLGDFVLNRVSILSFFVLNSLKLPVGIFLNGFLIANGNQDKPEHVPFVVTYNPALPSILSDYSQTCGILISFPRCSKVSKAAPIVASRRAVNTRR